MTQPGFYDDLRKQGHQQDNEQPNLYASQVYTAPPNPYHDYRQMYANPYTAQIQPGNNYFSVQQQILPQSNMPHPIYHGPMQIANQPHLQIDSQTFTKPVFYGDINQGFDARLRGDMEQRRAVKQIELTSGNLVVDIPVPDKVLTNTVHRVGNEFTHLRYTACTCDPDDFTNEDYTLRPRLFSRETELFIVMTMYNENDVLFARTFHAVMKNIAYLCSRDRSKKWGKNGWKKVCVCIVADGRSKVHPRALTVLEALGVYQNGIAKNTFNGKPVTAHLFEYTTQLSVDSQLRIRGADEGVVPMQVLFCLKEKNAKKINSHRWFFNAFSPILRPNVCVLLDVGTKPENSAIYNLWKAFDRDPQVGGACGEICADLGPHCRLLLNPLVATQNFEYKMSNILDKPLESVFGYISVLPGAFSAYRYKALQNVNKYEGPLYSYFKGETMHDSASSSGIFEANMYLAEDRILCFELVAKRNSNWILKYVKVAPLNVLKLGCESVDRCS